MSNPFEAPTINTQLAIPRRRQLKNVGVLSMGYFFGAAGIAFGLIAGIIMVVFSVVPVAIGQAEPAMFLPGLFMLLFFPIMYGFLGFLGGLINACIYNLVAGITGGIEMTFSDN